MLCSVKTCPADIHIYHYVRFLDWCVAAAPVVASAEGFREFGDCAVFTDRNQDTCEAVTSSDNPLDFVLRANLTQYQTNFDARITLHDGNCGDSSQVKKKVLL